MNTGLSAHVYCRRSYLPLSILGLWLVDSWVQKVWVGSMFYMWSKVY